MTALKRILGLRLRVTGTENLVNRTTLFVANHFTRIETFLIPYVIWQYAGRQVRSLGTPSVFRGLFGRYFQALGGMSTLDPRRNRTIIKELMTGRSDWIIYPEGGLIKNKKTVDRGRLRLTHPERHGPPHTGAAVLALKAQVSKRQYLDACADGDRRRIEYYEATYGLTGPEEVSPENLVVVPVTLNFYPMRPTRNLLNRLARFIVSELDPRIDEELQVEGSILFKGSEISVHFGTPVEVAHYVGRVREAARRFMGMFSEARGTELFLHRQAKRLTYACMQSIYGNVEVNFDHLFSYALRACKGEQIPVDDLRAALYLAASELAAGGVVRVHPLMADSLTTLVTGETCPPWDDAMALATAEGVITRANEHLNLNRVALLEHHEFHTIRLRKMTQVIANELEPVRPAVEAVRRNVNLSSEELHMRTARSLRETERLVYERDYATAFDPNESRARELGEPFFLEAKGATTGVVLAHGYLASPCQIRGLAERLHAEGFSVCGVRLTGHGTAPEQLASVRWEDWLECLFRGYGLVRQRCDQVIAGGFSLGGVLALLLAARLGSRVQGVFSISPPFRLRDRRLPLIGPLLGLNGALRKVGLAEGDFRIANEGTEADEINYRTDYLKGVRELRQATRACRRCLGSITVPALIVQGDADPLVNPAGGRQALADLGSQDKVLTTLAFDRHVIVRHEGSGAVFSLVARFVKRLAGAYSSAASR